MSREWYLDVMRKESYAANFPRKRELALVFTKLVFVIFYGDGSQLNS